MRATFEDPSDFDGNHDYDYLRPVYPPRCYVYIFNMFLEIYNLSKDGMTWQDIQAYIFCRDIRLSQSEIDLILLCSSWANEQIQKLRDEEED